MSAFEKSFAAGERGAASAESRVLHPPTHARGPPALPQSEVHAEAAVQQDRLRSMGSNTPHNTHMDARRTDPWRSRAVTVTGAIGGAYIMAPRLNDILMKDLGALTNAVNDGIHGLENALGDLWDSNPIGGVGDALASGFGSNTAMTLALVGMGVFVIYEIVT